MPRDYALITDVLEYNSAIDKTNAKPNILVVPSQNVVINRQRKVESRGGYTRLGAANSASNAIRNAVTWQTSTGVERPMRSYDDELEVYLGTVDGDVIDGWRRVTDGRSTTEILRFATWWDGTEDLDLLLWVEGDDNIYEWNGAVAVVASTGTNTLTKKGTATWSQNRFYNARDRTIINVRTGVEFAYTGGDGTTTLTGVTPDPAGADIVAGDIFIQKIVTNANTPATDRNNHTIFQWENQIAVGSDDDNEVRLSKNTSFTDYAFSSPRTAGEGATFTLDGPSKGAGALGQYLILFAGDGIFRVNYELITVSTTLSEQIRVKKLNTGPRQGSRGADSITHIGNEIVYLSNEPALRSVQDPDQLEGPNVRTLSNPIKPDFDAEDFANAHLLWSKNSLYLSSPVNSRLYILEFIEDADGNVRRFWQPPQILPARALSIIDGDFHIHSNGNPETYKFPDGRSDTATDDSKLPIHSIAAFAYRNFGKRGLLKNFDEYFVEGEVTGNADVTLTLNYDFGGHTLSVEKTIDGADEDIIEETLENASLGQQPLGQVPLGGASSAPSDARKFRVYFEIPGEDFVEVQPIFSFNDADFFFSILAHGPNVRLSRRRNISKHK